MTWPRLAWSVPLLSSVAAIAQQYTISTYAGDAPPPTPAPGISASIGDLGGVAADAAGNVFFASSNCVFRLDANGTLTRVAGNARAGYSGDGGPATSAQLSGPNGIALDKAGNLYIADTDNHRVRKVSPPGVISTIAGNGTGGYSGDGGPATSAELSYPAGVAVDSAGNVYIADEDNNRIRRVTQSGVIGTFAGNGTQGSSGDGGPGAGAELNEPFGVAVDSAGNLYIADTFNSRIRKVTPSGVMVALAGSGTVGFSGDGGPADDAELAFPWAVAVDAGGNLYIADTFNNRVRKVTPSGVITTVAGDGIQGYSGDEGPAARSELYTPCGVAVNAAGNLYLADYSNYRIRQVTPSGIISTAAGNGTYGYSGDGGSAASAQLPFGEKKLSAKLRVTGPTGAQWFVESRVKGRELYLARPGE